MKIHIPILVTLALVSTVQAKTIYVDDDASAGGDGSAWGNAHKYLQDALAAATEGDEIWVAEGTYKPDQGEGKTAGDRTANFLLVDGVGMYGGFTGAETTRTPLGDGNQTILSGEIDENSSLWSLNVVTGVDLSSSIVVDGFRITKGNANGELVYGNGGGMYLKNSSPTLTNCVFTNNSASSGGGMYNTNSSPTLTDCVFSGNSADGSGGGMFNANSYPTLTDCTFTNNSAWKGGGMVSSDSSPTLTNCTFSGNSADISGGGMFIQHGRSLDWPLITNAVSYPTLTDCVFTDNMSRKGGGMHTGTLAFPTLTNCMFSGNSADISGGGMWNTGKSSPTLTNCTFLGNSASDEGGGMHNWGYSSPTLTNCILWKNLTNGTEGHGIDGDDPPSWKGIILEAAVAAEFPGDPNAKDAVYFTSNILQGWTGDGRAISADPLFNNPDNPIGPDDKWFTADDGLRLKEDSPAIDAGYNASLPPDAGDVDGDGDKNEPVPLDLAGFVRVQNGKVDIGPYEYGDSSIPTHFVSLVANPSGVGTLTGDGVYGEDNSTAISATPNPGYLFSGWSGDANGTTNPLTITVDAAKTITANFAQDLNDTDGDGLTNYDELVTHGTKADDNDTDDDGLLDNEEIQIGTNPTSSDATLVTFFNEKAATNEAAAKAAGIAAVQANPTDYDLHTEEDMNASVESARTTALAEGRTTGIAAVKADPTAYGLADLGASVDAVVESARTTALAEGQATGIAAVQANPTDYDLHTEEDLNASVETARTTAIAAVKADPTSFGLALMEVLENVGNTPHTNEWYYQPEWGWMWTTEKTFPYVYLTGENGRDGGWLYFREGSATPIYFFDYTSEEWLTLGE